MRNITGQTNIPLRFAEYTGLATDTAIVIINNNVNNRTIAVDVSKVPNDLVFTINDLESSEVSFNGSEATSIDLKPFKLKV